MPRSILAVLNQQMCYGGLGGRRPDEVFVQSPLSDARIPAGRGHRLPTADPSISQRVIRAACNYDEEEPRLAGSPLWPLSVGRRVPALSVTRFLTSINFSKPGAPPRKGGFNDAQDKSAAR